MRFHRFHVIGFVVPKRRELHYFHDNGTFADDGVSRGVGAYLQRVPRDINPPKHNPKFSKKLPNTILLFLVHS